MFVSDRRILYRERVYTHTHTEAAFDNGDYSQENASQHVTNTVLYLYTQGSF